MKHLWSSLLRSSAAFNNFKKRLTHVRGSKLLAPAKCHMDAQLSSPASCNKLCQIPEVNVNLSYFLSASQKDKMNIFFPKNMIRAFKLEKFL